ncbi:uracil-DNA glycosylase family protein [Halorubellus sp. PRR65]|uniref:uracil-DNA glycosylase n=1 Tax=Halorubellus sp. PRR65 TaxID=3098148 RepID=UPI002B25E58E|nr:uracil-DNA glycosylase family protein [Halorubellus sp. PRR65]
MDANQLETSNPFGMDEECRNCPALCETREHVVHGYGDVGADFLFVVDAPGAGADESAIPAFHDAGGERFRRVLERCMLCASASPEAEPDLSNAYVTSIARCHHPDRDPSDEEVGNCEPYLNAELRMINPEILVPVGERALAELAAEYTTTPASELSVDDHHATSVRGRGFELAPMKAPAAMTDDDEQAFVEFFAELMASDYRQTKGRQER